ncbi:hypothetical protein WJX81_006947 [Elliptochloris bilobata]|uniref:Ubiquitin thioesterase OTU n=1 Tax=Elliptochloris bilobata TaxID=381761 RepID=A0AAW1RYX6_9CHLO
MKLRCRGPTGQSTLTGLGPALSVAALQDLLAERTGVPPHEQELLTGFPPAVLRLPDDRSAAASAALPLASGDTLVAVRGTPAAEAGAGHAAAGWNGLRSAEDEDEDLARAIAASLGQELPPRTGPAPASDSDIAACGAASAGPTRASGAAAGPPAAARPQQQAAPTEVALSEGSGAAIARRIIASDNSCLFNAVGYVMEGSRSKAAELRRVIAAAVAGDPEMYSEAFLGRPNADYCRWILSQDKWGGAIELSILSRHYERELAAYDVQTKRCDVYGQDSGYPQRGMLIYDGLHYDALALAAFPGAAEELDVTMLEAGPLLTLAERAAAELVSKAHEARQFTDIGNFTLRCGVCQVGVRGEKEAMEHAKVTGHSNFSEYN